MHPRVYNALNKQQNKHERKTHTMKKAIKVISVILALAMVACCFASCGQKDTDPTNSATPSGDTTKAESKEVVKLIKISLTDEEYGFAVGKDNAELLKSLNEFIAEMKKDGTLQAIMDKYFGSGTPEGIKSAELDKSKDQLVVSTNAEFAPFEYKDGDTFYGVDLEIVNTYAKKVGKELVIKDIDFNSVLNEVESGNADMSASGLTVNEERKKQVNFTDTYYTASQYVIAPASDTKFDACTTREDVEKVLQSFDDSVAIGFQSGTTAEYYVKGDEDWGFPGLKTKAQGYDSGALAAQDMINGNIQYVIIDEAPATVIVDNYNAK